MSLRSSYTSSSTFCVLSGSSDAVGSSSSSTVGSVASARAMQSRCCCPPESADRARLAIDPSPRPTVRPARARSRRSRRSRARDGLRAVEHAKSGGDVVADGHRRKRRRPLEDHADVLAHRDRVHAARVDVARRRASPRLRRARRDRLVHPVETSQQRRLAAARRTDDCRDLRRRGSRCDAADGACRAEVRVEAPHAHARRRVRRVSCGGDGVTATTRHCRRRALSHRHRPNARAR